MISQTDNMLYFFFNDTATTEIYTLSLHDALPICKVNQADIYDLFMLAVQQGRGPGSGNMGHISIDCLLYNKHNSDQKSRSEEHTSELQSRQYLVCRLLLEKKKQLNLLQSLFNSSL